MKLIHLIALSLAATFFADAASASLTPFARAYTVDGWSLVGYAGGTGATHVRRYIGPNRKTVSVSMTGFRARATHRDCYGRDPDSCYGMTVPYRELNETSAYIRDQHYDKRTGWLTFTVIVVQRGRTYLTNTALWWQLGYVVDAAES